VPVKYIISHRSEFSSSFRLLGLNDANCRFRLQLYKMSHPADVEPRSSSEASYQFDAVTNGKHCSRCQRVMGPDWERGTCSDCERRDGEKAKEHRSNLKVVLARQASGTAGSGHHDVGNMSSSVRCISYFKLRQLLARMCFLYIFWFRPTAVNVRVEFCLCAWDASFMCLFEACGLAPRL
jgi:hypothetical protein